MKETVNKEALLITMLIPAMLLLLAAGCSRTTGTSREQPSDTSALSVTDKVNETGNMSRVCYKEHCFSVELAITEQEQETGLMYRRHMDPDKGMLFIFSDEGEYDFWMMNTLIPLDMIWIDSDGEVVFISRNSQPCSATRCPVISPGKNASYVLEINAGIADMIGLKEGSKLTIG